jgi:hypothetical protein
MFLKFSFCHGISQFVSDVWNKIAAVDVLLQIWNVLGLCLSLKMSFKREVSPEPLRFFFPYTITFPAIVATTLTASP